MLLNEKIRLEGTRTVLVPYEKMHVPVYHGWMESDALRRLTASERLTLDQEYEMQNKWRHDSDKCTFIILSRSVLDQGRSEIEAMVGDVNVFLWDEKHAEVEVMIANESNRGQGMGCEAVILMILYLTHAYPHSLSFFAKVASENTASLNLFGKLGFSLDTFSEIFQEQTLKLDPEKVELLKEHITEFKISDYSQTSI